MSLNPKVALVVLSGGQDSTTCLVWAATRFDVVHAITFDYGQRHASELMAAQNVWLLAQKLYPSVAAGTRELVCLGGDILASTSPLVDKKAALEQYAGPYDLPGGIEKTFVPMRNQLFLTIAANRAVALRAGVLVTGVCQEDFGGYPDCRDSFIHGLEEATNLSLGLESGEGLAIATPLMHLSKAKTVHMMADYGDEAFALLAFTQTSYDGAYPPLGKDHATLLREKGFIEAGMADPLMIRASLLDGLVSSEALDRYTDGAYAEAHMNISFVEILKGHASHLEAFRQLDAEATPA